MSALGVAMAAGPTVTITIIGACSGFQGQGVFASLTYTLSRRGSDDMSAAEACTKVFDIFGVTADCVYLSQSIFEVCAVCAEKKRWTVQKKLFVFL